VLADHVADDSLDAFAWSQEIERLRDPSHWASLPAQRLHALGAASGLTLEDERLFGLELDFDDWLARGSASAADRRLVERALGQPPAAVECFKVDEAEGRRVLKLRVWLSRWRRN
jgi:hypothetical protein